MVTSIGHYSELDVDLRCSQLQLQTEREQGEILMLDSAVTSKWAVSTAAVLLRTDQAWHCSVCLRTR